MNIALTVNISAPEGTDAEELAERFFDFLCNSDEIDTSPLLAAITSFDGVEVEG